MMNFFVLTCSDTKQTTINESIKNLYDTTETIDKKEISGAPESQEAFDSPTRISYIDIVQNIMEILLINHKSENLLTDITQSWPT